MCSVNVFHHLSTVVNEVERDDISDSMKGFRENVSPRILSPLHTNLKHQAVKMCRTDPPTPSEFRMSSHLQHAVCLSFLISSSFIELAPVDSSSRDSTGSLITDSEIVPIYLPSQRELALRRDGFAS